MELEGNLAHETAADRVAGNVRHRLLADAHGRERLRIERIVRELAEEGSRERPCHEDRASLGGEVDHVDPQP